MGRLGKVIKSFIDKLSGSGSNAQFSSVEEFAGDQRTAQAFGPCNEDFSPPESCRTFDVPIGKDRGYLLSIAYHNQLINPVAVHGEKRIFSTNQAGDTVMSEVFLKQDGSVLIKNSLGSFEMKVSGEFEINGATITIDGDFITAAGISLDTHVHEQGNDSDGDIQEDTEAAK